MLACLVGLPLALPAHGAGPADWAVIGYLGVAQSGLAYLALSNVGSALVYYLTPGELLARGAAGVGETVRLGGQVQPGSVMVDSDAERYERRLTPPTEAVR